MRRGFGRRFPALLMARRNLRRTTLRSVLAALGIVIGVVAIASLGMVGTAIQQTATTTLGDIGNEVVVSPAFQAGVGRLTDRDVREIERVAGNSAVVPVKSTRASVRFDPQQELATIYGMRNPGDIYTASDGRIPDPLRSGALVGADLAERLGVRPGNTITVAGDSYRVVGVLATQSGFSPVNPNSAVVLPQTAFRSTGYSQVVLTAESGRAANQTAMAVRAALNDRGQRVEIFEFASITRQIDEFFGLLNVFLLGIGFISLFVAGVAILNVMLMSTVERREEIGVLRAVGYQRTEVLRILLTEAMLLGVTGGVVGALASVLVGMALNWIALGDPLFVFQPRNVGFLLLALVVGVVVSAASGLYPAWRAANANPVDALRK